MSRRVKAIIFASERNKSCPLHQFCWHILAKWRKNKNGRGGLFWSAISANVHQFDFGMAASLCKWYKGMDTKHSKSNIWTDIECIESVRNVILLEKLLINGPSRSTGHRPLKYFMRWRKKVSIVFMKPCFGQICLAKCQFRYHAWTYFPILWQPNYFWNSSSLDSMPSHYLMLFFFSFAESEANLNNNLMMRHSGLSIQVWLL